MNAVTSSSRQDKSAWRIRDAGFFAIRTPLLPLAELLAWSEGLQPSDSDALRARLRAIIVRPEIQEALHVASPSLAGELESWFREPTSERGQKAERGLVRYFSRMCSRATPFGLFAGCSVGAVGATTRLSIGGLREYRSHTRLDMNYVCALADDLVQLPAVSEVVSYRPNSSLYRVGDQFRYLEWKRSSAGHRSYGLVAVPATDPLCQVLARSAHGARRAELVDLLIADDLSHDEVSTYVGELIASQILVADFPPRVTGPEPLGELIARTAAIEELQPITEALRDTRRLLTALDQAEIGGRVARYREIPAALAAVATPIDPARLLQVDMVKPAPDATLGPEVIAEITRAVDWLRRLDPTSPNQLVADFAHRFVKRYEGREVRLVEALDEEWGVAPPNAEASPLLEGLAFSGARHDVGQTVRPIHDVLARAIEGAVRLGAGELVLDEAWLRPFLLDAPPSLFPSFSVMATVAARSSEAVAQGAFRVVVDAVRGPSGAALLGRFCHADPHLQRCIEDYARREQAASPEVIYAEVVHLPQERVGNILARPVLTEYEIVYLGQSGVPIENQIPVTDLLVSVVAGRVVLRSERLGREVIPRVTTAHNLFNGLAMYRFLGALSTAPSLVFDIGALEALSFVPRIVVGRIVLRLATWRLVRDELKALDQPTAERRVHAAQELRRARRLPRIVAVKDHDNELPIDFDNALSIESFVQLVKRRPGCVLVEIYPGADELCAQGPEGGFVHELIVPFLNEATEPARPRLTQSQPTSSRGRQFAPGSEWLYLKFYTGHTGADRLLRDVISPVVREAANERTISQWFFLRYADPEFHLRVRFRGEPAALNALIPRIHERCTQALDTGLLHRLQLDTYEREIERYGGEAGTVLAEQLFCIDSDACLAVLDTLDVSSELDDRWRFTLLGMDLLLKDLRLDLPQRRAIIEQQRAGFGAEFGVGVLVERSLGQKFRKERSRIDSLMNLPAHPASQHARAAFRERSRRLVAVVNELAALEQSGQLTVPIAELAKSFIHMHANRLLRSAPRHHELVLYDFLDRCYAAEVARAKPPRAATIATGA
jgi:thiopeptide-type bacteriocin biosynthesis protein